MTLIERESFIALFQHPNILVAKIPSKTPTHHFPVQRTNLTHNYENKPK